MKYLFAALLLLVQPVFGLDACGVMISTIEEELPLFGILDMTEKGFLYVDVDDDYIHQLISFIEDEGFEEPPYFGNGLVGAHITVAYETELKEKGIAEVVECGEEINFTVQECHAVQPITWKEVDWVYVIVIDAPRLDEIRAKYGLSKKGHPFHITVGIKRPIAA